MRRWMMVAAVAPLLVAQAQAPTPSGVPTGPAGVPAGPQAVPAAPPAPSGADGTAAVVAEPPPAEQLQLYHGEATGLVGRSVRDPQGEQMGRVVDVLVDDAGLPRAAVIDLGGFMGMGSRRIAVVWRALHFDTALGVGRITIDMTLDQVKDTPEYRRLTGPTDPPVAVAAPPKH